MTTYFLLELHFFSILKTLKEMSPLCLELMGDDFQECSSCKFAKHIDKFDGFLTCNWCRESQRRCRAKIKDEVVTCPVCTYERKKYKQAQHEKSQTHQYYLQKLSDPDFEKDVPKPDKIRAVDGKEHYMCNKCNSGMIACMWARHFNKPPHLKPTTA